MLRDIANQLVVFASRLAKEIDTSAGKLLRANDGFEQH
jgi:hypothetical protein